MANIRIYYRPDSPIPVWDGDLAAPGLIPHVTDVQAVIFEDPVTGHTNEVSPEGYWVYRDGIWHGSDQMGFWSYLQGAPGAKYVLFGSTMTVDMWASISRQAESFRRKSAIHPGEEPTRG